MAAFYISEPKNSTSCSACTVRIALQGWECACDSRQLVIRRLCGASVCDVYSAISLHTNLVRVADVAQVAIISRRHGLLPLRRGLAPTKQSGLLAQLGLLSLYWIMKNASLIENVGSGYERPIALLHRMLCPIYNIIVIMSYHISRHIELVACENSSHVIPHDQRYKS